MPEDPGSGYKSPALSNEWMYECKGHVLVRKIKKFEQS